MSRTLSDIQENVRVLIRDSNFSIIDNSSSKFRGLRMANKVYRKLCSINNWPELVQTDTSINTVAGTSSYNYPSSPKFIDVFDVQALDPGVNQYYSVVKCQNELDWLHFTQKENGGFPLVYRFENISSVKKITFAPTPDYAFNILIRGLIEPADLIDGNSTTIFDSQLLDDSFEFLIAAERQFKQKFVDDATINLQKASNLITRLSNREIPPSEIDPRVVVDARAS